MSARNPPPAGGFVMVTDNAFSESTRTTSASNAIHPAQITGPEGVGGSASLNSVRSEHRPVHNEALARIDPFYEFQDRTVEPGPKHGSVMVPLVASRKSQVAICRWHEKR